MCAIAHCWQLSTVTKKKKMGKEEDYKKLMDDSEFKKGERVCKRLEQAGNNVLSARKMTLKTLRSLKKEVETSYDMSRKSIIGGTTGIMLKLWYHRIVLQCQECN